MDRNVARVVVTSSLVLLASLALKPNAHADPWTAEAQAKLVPAPNNPPSLLTLDPSVSILPGAPNTLEDGRARIKGVASRGDVSILLDRKQKMAVNKAPPYDFTFFVPIKAPDNVIELTTVLPEGKSVAERWNISFHEYDRWIKDQKLPKALRRFAFQGSLGPTLIDYAETRPDNASVAGNNLALTGRLATVFAIQPGRWLLEANAFMNLFTLSKLDADRTFRFFGASLKGGYLVPLKSPRWRLGIWAGMYFTTMLTDDLSYGFRNMSGPQITPNAAFVINPRQTLGLALKWSPILDADQFFSLANRELAASLFWRYRRPDSFWSYGTSLTYAHIQIHFPQDITVRSGSLTLGFDLGWQ